MWDRRILKEFSLELVGTFVGYLDGIIYIDLKVREYGFFYYFLCSFDNKMYLIYIKCCSFVLYIVLKRENEL